MAKQSFLAVSQTHVSVTTLSLPILPSAVPYAAADCNHAKHQGAEVDAMAKFVTRPVECQYKDRWYRKGGTDASFCKYVKVAMNAAQLAMAIWRPTPVART